MQLMMTSGTLLSLIEIQITSLEHHILLCKFVTLTSTELLLGITAEHLRNLALLFKHKFLFISQIHTVAAHSFNKMS